MLRFTEINYDDAERFAQYLHGNGHGEIEVTTEDSSLFPKPPKFMDMPASVDCFRVGNVEIAYLSQEKSDETKPRNRALYRYAFGQLLQDTRERKGMTIDELSAKSGLSKSKISSIEHGRYGESIETLCHLASTLGYHITLTKD